MDLELEVEEREIMEHNPFLTLEDDTVITYSDLKIKENGEEYITLYFETPDEKKGFCSMKIDSPNGTPQDIAGYSEKQVNKLLYHYYKAGKIAFISAKENVNCCIS